ncbi:hypothetical protein [Roseovarius aestuariivivens]|uniref:hypothetical protein n=1 Tax=Roseovarius aestuariivivens TaxID=1888910 RepID=UPI0010822522|nr:hypothetical protein [Roseovarius aestuariivivens]
MTGTPASIPHLMINFTNENQKPKKIDCGPASYSLSFDAPAQAGAASPPLVLHCTLGSCRYLPELLELLQTKKAFVFVLGNPTADGTIEKSGFRYDVTDAVLDHISITGEPGLEEIAVSIKVQTDSEFHYFGKTHDNQGKEISLDDTYIWKQH